MSESAFSKVLRDEMRAVAKEVFAEEKASAGQSPPPDSEVLELRLRLQRIMAKEYITANEAAFLFGCSARHFHNLVSKARRGGAEKPVPYISLDGVTVFPRAELIEWAARESRRATGPGQPETKLVGGGRGVI